MNTIFAGLDRPPTLPRAAGPASALVIDALAGPAGKRCDAPGPVPADSDPFGLDLQLALYLCYELHYRGFAGVDPDWEWNPALIALRTDMERILLSALHHNLGPAETSITVACELRRLSTGSVHGSGIGAHLREHGTWPQMREYFVHRSLYHLKEADPHAWLIPRLTGQAKSALVAVEFDEFGAGHANRMHQRLYADLMTAAGLDPAYLGYLDAVPAPALLVVNLMSLFGLHRRLRGAGAGQFAAIEITSPPGSQRIVDALRRMAAPQPCVRFYAEHVEADAVHEQVVRGLVEALLAAEPDLAVDVIFGIRAWEFSEQLLADLLRRCWAAGRPSLRRGIG